MTTKFDIYVFINLELRANTKLDFQGFDYYILTTVILTYYSAKEGACKPKGLNRIAKIGPVILIKT
jgi:hypothetical protein